MAKPQFTPGPWRWTEFSDEGCWDMKRAKPEEGGPFQGLWSDSGDCPVAIAQDASAYTASFIDEDSADAHLIAAAPDLLQALEAWQGVFERLVAPRLKGLPIEAAVEVAVMGAGEIAHAALAKARGEEVGP